MNESPLLGRSDAVPRRRWRWLLPLLIGVAVVGLIGSFVARAMNEEDANSPKAALDAYLTAVEKGETDRAYGMLCSKEKKPTLAEFETIVGRERADSGGVLRHRFGDFHTASKGLVVAKYTVQFERTYKWLAAAIVQERDGWKVCGFATIPRPEVRLPASQIPVPPGFGDNGTTTTTR